MNTAAIIEEYGRSFAATIRLMMGPGTPIELCPDDSGRYDLRSYPWEQVNRQDFWSSTKFLRKILFLQVNIAAHSYTDEVFQDHRSLQKRTSSQLKHSSENGSHKIGCDCSARK